MTQTQAKDEIYFLKDTGSAKSFIEKLSVKIRKVKCPVRSFYFDKTTEITEYAIPIVNIDTDKLTQARNQGRDQRKIAEISDSIYNTGQEEGCCVEIKKDSNGVWRVFLRWGSHRLEAGELLNLRGEPIKGLDVGYIWVNQYTYQPSELRKFQSIENNLTKPYQPASAEDNLTTLEDETKSGTLDIIVDGALKKFADMSEEKQREQLAAYIKDYMPAYNNAKKSKQLINRFFTSKKNPYKSDTMSKREMIVYFNNHNKYGIKWPTFSKAHTLYTDENGIRHKVATLHAPLDGSVLSNLMHGKAKGRFDVVHLIMSLPRASLKSTEAMGKKRKENKDFFSWWHRKVSRVKVIDHLYCPPQSDPERDAARINCDPWVKIYDFKDIEDDC